MTQPADPDPQAWYHRGREMEKVHRLHDAAVCYCAAGAWIDASRVLSHSGRFYEAGMALLLEVPAGARTGSISHEMRQRALDAATCFARGGARVEAVALLQALGENGKAANLLVRAGLRDEAVAAMRGEPIPGGPWPRGTIGPLLNPQALLARVQVAPQVDDSEEEADGGLDTSSHAREPVADPRPRSTLGFRRPASVEAALPPRPPEPTRTEPPRGPDAASRVDLPRPEPPGRGPERPPLRLQAGPVRAPLTAEAPPPEAQRVDAPRGAVRVPAPSSRAPAPANRPPVRVVVDLGAGSVDRTQDVPEVRRTDDDGIGPGTLVRDRYRIVRHIGSGGMATVFEAIDEELGERIALKLFRVIVDDPQRLRRFRREMKINRRLHHPNIVQTLEYGTWRGARFITMELLQGEDLASFLSKERPDDARLVRMMMQACDGLGAAHKEGVVHRDVKPANLFVCEEGTRIKVMDFGIAKAVDSSTISVTGVRMGTPKYMAPEQIQGNQTIEPAADLYSLGCVLFEALMGRPVFDSSELMPLLLNHLSEEPPRPRSLRPDLPEEVEDLLLRLLAKNPRERFVDAAAVKSALLRAYVAIERLR